EPERVAEDLVAHGRVALGPVADREDVARAPEQHLEGAEREQQPCPEGELRMVAVQDAAVDPLLHHQRREDGGRLPAETACRGADHARALAPDRGAQEAPRGRAAISLHRPKARDTLGRMTVALERRFPRPSVMGVVNVTPDSFSDGGVNFRAEDAVAAG